MNLDSHVIIVIVFDLATALHLAHSPIATRTTFQNVHADPYAGLFEGSLEDCRHRTVGHQGGGPHNGFGMLPRRLLNKNSAREDKTCHLPDFQTDLFQ